MNHYVPSPLFPLPLVPLRLDASCIHGEEGILVTTAENSLLPQETDSDQFSAIQVKNIS